MPNTRSSTPRLSAEDLLETMDLLSTVIASVSDRVDNQGGAIDQLIKTAAETRQAAFAARAQTDPTLYADNIAQMVRTKTASALDALEQVSYDLSESTRSVKQVLDKIEGDKWQVLRDLRNREEKAQKLKRALPFFGIIALVAALAMSFVLPRVFATNLTACTVMGGEWVKTTSGVDACVFYKG
jgi:ABC-type transporter Mla subunit MlaD